MYRINNWIHHVLNNKARNFFRKFLNIACFCLFFFNRRPGDDLFSLPSPPFFHLCLCYLPPPPRPKPRFIFLSVLLLLEDRDPHCQYLSQFFKPIPDFLGWTRWSQKNILESFQNAVFGEMIFPLFFFSTALSFFFFSVIRPFCLSLLYNLLGSFRISVRPSVDPTGGGVIFEKCKIWADLNQKWHQEHEIWLLEGQFNKSSERIWCLYSVSLVSLPLREEIFHKLFISGHPIDKPSPHWIEEPGGKGLEGDWALPDTPWLSRRCTMVQNNYTKNCSVYHLFALSLAPLTHMLALPCSFCSCAPLCIFICLLACSLIHSLPNSWESGCSET